MSRLWENPAPATSETSAERAPVVDIRDGQDEQIDVSVRAEGDDVVLTLPIDSTTDLHLTLSREEARQISAALDAASRQ